MDGLMAKDQDHLWMATTLIDAYPSRYAGSTRGTSIHRLTAERLADDVAMLLSKLPDDTDEEPKRVRPMWGQRPAGFAP